MNNKTNQKKIGVTEAVKQLLKVTGVISLIMLVLYYFYPVATAKSINISVKYFAEMLLIFPGVILLMSLADVWIPKNLIKKYLGQNAGVKGILIAAALGTLPTGPMYIAFPVAGELLNKGASVSNIVVFLGVWAALKIPQIGVEVQFLGLKFSALRFLLTLISILAIGFITEKIVKRPKKLTAK